MFDIPKHRGKRYAYKWHRTYYAGSYLFLVPDGLEDVTMAWDALLCSHIVDEAMCYISSVIFSMLSSLIKNSQRSALKDKELGDWQEGTKCRLDTGRLSQVFC